MSHVLPSKTEMEVQHLMVLLESDNELSVQVRWHELPGCEDIYESFGHICREVA